MKAEPPSRYHTRPFSQCRFEFSLAGAYSWMTPQLDLGADCETRAVAFAGGSPMFIKRASISVVLLVVFAFGLAGCASTKAETQAMSGEPVSQTHDEGPWWSEP